MMGLASLGRLGLAQQVACDVSVASVQFLFSRSCFSAGHSWSRASLPRRRSYLRTAPSRTANVQLPRAKGGCQPSAPSATREPPWRLGKTFSEDGWPLHDFEPLAKARVCAPLFVKAFEASRRSLDCAQEWRPGCTQVSACGPRKLSLLRALCVRTRGAWQSRCVLGSGAAGRRELLGLRRMRLLRLSDWHSERRGGRLHGVEGLPGARGSCFQLASTSRVHRIIPRLCGTAHAQLQGQ